MSDQMSTGFPMNLIGCRWSEKCISTTKKKKKFWRIDSSLIISISMNGKAEREITLCFPFPNLNGQMFAVMWVEKLV